MKLLQTLFFTVLFLCVSYFAEAQLSAPGNYASRPVNDGSGMMLYFFSDIAKAALKAESSDVSSFRWLRHNSLSGLFEEVKTETSVTVSEFVPVASGCYRVDVGGVLGDDKSYICWCLSPQIDSVKVDVSESTCYLLSLEGKAFAMDMEYYNPTSGQIFKEPQVFQWSWFSKPLIDVLTNKSSPHITIDAPVEDVIITAQVTNEAGVVFNQDIDFKALAVFSKFAFEPDDRDWPHELGDEKELSAPATLRFDNQSKGNITAYEWSFEWTLDAQTNTNRVYERLPIYTFQQPGNYQMKLLVTNEKSGCFSDSEVQSVKVLDSYIEFPNVFTPNGDGVNDEFRPAFNSIKSYHLVIYNRWGGVVYESSNLEKGWDGRMGSREMAEGVYFFVCKAEGYLKGEVHRKKGSVTLLR